MMVVKLRGTTTSFLQSGFALIEMIGVIAIMAILAGAMAPFLLNQIDNSDADAEQLALEAIAEGVRQYYRDASVATYGTLPANLAALSGTYVAASGTGLTESVRGIDRLYANNLADLTSIPQVTILSHLLVGGAAPTGLAATCIGIAQVAEDPCGDSPGTVTDDMPVGIGTGLIKVVNLNLAAERSALIEYIQGYYLAPVVSAVEGLSNDVCQQIANGTSTINGLDLAGNAIPAELLASAPGATDLWGNTLQVTKTDNRLDIWSSGPVAMAAVPANPLYLSASCAPGSDLDQQFESIFNAIVGYAANQSPISLPDDNPAAPLTWNAIVGLSVGDIADPWGNAITYGEVGNDVTLTSLGPDGGVGGDDITTTKSSNEFTGLFANMGLSFNVAEPVSPFPADYVDCSVVEAWLGAEDCDTALGYLTNASNCNEAIVYDQECTVAGY